MTDYAPSLVILLGVTALKQLQVLVVGSLGMLRSYGIIAHMSFFLVFMKPCCHSRLSTWSLCTRVLFQAMSTGRFKLGKRRCMRRCGVRVNSAARRGRTVPPTKSHSSCRVTAICTHTGTKHRYVAAPCDICFGIFADRYLIWPGMSDKIGCSI